MYLFFDTETTGLPLNWKAPVTDLKNWPRLVQLAWIVYDGAGNKLSEKDFIIKPQGFSIPDDATRIHGISTSKAEDEGCDLVSVLTEFNLLIDEAKLLVAHNMSFDEKIIGAELIRCNLNNNIPEKNRICTMESSTSFCAINGPYGYKWPKLAELHYKLFHTHFDETHNATMDIEITAKCFWELINRGVISIQNVEDEGQLEGEIKKEIKSENNYESSIIIKDINEFCSQVGFSKIPLTAKAFTINLFENRCKKIPISADINNEFSILNRFSFNSSSDYTLEIAGLNNYQKSFLLAIKEEILSGIRMNEFTSNKKDFSLDEKLHFYALIGTSRLDDEKFRSLIIRLYFYYLVRYKEFLPINKRPANFNLIDKKIDFSKYVVETIRIYERIEHFITEFESMDGYLISEVYELAVNCKRELTSLKHMRGNKDNLYIIESSRVVKYVMRLLMNWMESRDSNLDVCDRIILVIKDIEINEDTSTWFNYQKDRFKILRKKNNSGCYIATMAYNDYSHPKVICLRKFRDKHLLNNLLGRVFVSIYYYLSPRVVSKFKNMNYIKFFTRISLDLIIKFLLPMDVKK